MLDDENGAIIPSMTRVTEGGKFIFNLEFLHFHPFILFFVQDTYPISDNDSTGDSISLIQPNILKNEDQDELNGE